MTVETHARGRLALVTGASGFLGAAVALAAAREGFRLRVLARPASPRANLDALRAEVPGVEVALGDLRDRASLGAALRGVEVLFHVAADYRLWARDPAEMIASNVEGTRLLMEEALRAGVEQVVYTSSVATLRVPEDGTPGDEAAPLDPDEAIGPYKRSKTLAERLVEGMCARDGLPAVIVNPSTPIGPRDVKPTPTGRIVVEAALGRMPAFVDTGLNLVHVDDCARGHLRALHRGRIGERYILGGQDVTLAEILGEIARLCGRKPPRVRLPRGAIFPLAYAAEAVARLTGKEPFVTVDGLRMARKRMFFSSAKAALELGHEARPYPQALADALAWFRAAGMVR